jgi:hypothetical protein
MKMSNINVCHYDSSNLIWSTQRQSCLGYLLDMLDINYSAFTFALDQSRLWKFGELYGKTVAG